MAMPSFELREFFHLIVLRHLTIRLSGRAWAVKGGACLRFFHRSPRLSEDIDLDVISGVRLETLRNAVDSILESRSLMASLIPLGIIKVNITKPKQTQTTQRWKAALELAGDISLPTKIEFSRRQEHIVYSKGVPDAVVLDHYKLTPFGAQFYDATQMAVQKIIALASPGRYAVRDLFDLYHLLSVVKVKAGDIANFIDKQNVKRAADKSAHFSHKDFKEQVLPYLLEELIALYQDPHAFKRMQDEVVGFLGLAS